MEGRGIRWAGDVPKNFIPPPPPLEHGIVFLLGPDQMRQRKLLGGEEQLKSVAERDFKGFIFAASATFEEELALLGIHEQLWRLAAAAGEFLDIFDNPDVVVGEDDGQFF